MEAGSGNGKARSSAKAGKAAESAGEAAKETTGDSVRRRKGCDSSNGRVCPEQDST